MKLRDYMDAFKNSLRTNPRKKVMIPNIADISRRAALGETWAKLALESGVSPHIISLRVREYRYDNFTTDAVLEDIRLERDSGKDWLELGTRAGWPTDRGSTQRFANEFSRLMNARVEARTKKKRGGGRPKKVLDASAYDDYRTGRKTIYEIADDNNMSVITARKRLLDLAGPDVTDLKLIVREEPTIDLEVAEQMVEELIEDVEEVVESTGIVGHGNIPKGFWDREMILQFLYDEDIEKEEVMEAFGLTADELDILVAIDIYPSGRIRALEEIISDSSSAIDDMIAAAVPDVSAAEEMRKSPRSLPKVPTADQRPVTAGSLLPHFSKPKVQEPSTKRRGRKKKVYNFTDAERAFIRDAYYDDKKHVWLIADILTKERGENVTQVAVKEVIADYSPGRGRRSSLDRSALERDAKRNLAVSTLAEIHKVSGPTIAKALREMGIKPIYSLDKEARLRKPSEEEIAERQAKLDAVQLQVEMILNDAARRQSIKNAYLSSNLITENDVAVLAAREGISTYNMACVLTDIFDDAVQRIQDRDRIDELVSEYGADQLRKIQRDLIDRRTLHLRGNPYDRNALSRYGVPGAQGVVAGLVVDQTVRYFYPNVSQNKRNLSSGALIVGVCVVDYMSERDEAKIWRAAGGVAGVLISRIIESKFQKHERFGI